MNTILYKISRFVEFSELYMPKAKFEAAIEGTAHYKRDKKLKCNNDKAHWYGLLVWFRLKSVL